METKAHYALVGFFAIALAAAAALFALWLGQLRFDQKYKELDIVFQGPVRGLAESGEVRFNGIKVGDVTRLQLDSNDPSLVRATVRIAEQTPIMRDTVAQLEPQGLTGVNYIQLNPGSPDSEPLIWRPGERPTLQSKPTQIESLLTSSEDIARAARETLARLNGLLTDETIQDMAAIIDNLSTITGQLAGKDGGAPLAVQLRDAVAQIDAAAEDVSRLAGTADGLLAGDVQTAVAEAHAAAAGVEKAAAEVEAILGDSRDPLARFANEGLPDLTLAISDLRRLLVDMEAIAAGLEEDPAAFVAGGRRQEVEIPK